MSPHDPETDNSKRLEKLFAGNYKRISYITVVRNAEFRICVLARVLAEILHGVVYHTDHTLNASYQISEIRGYDKSMSMPPRTKF